MKVTFADSSFFVAYLNKSDDAHSAARSAMDELAGRIVTTYWVLADVGNWSAARYRRHFCALCDALQEDRRFEIRDANTPDFNAVQLLYRRCQDKSWSLIDCISFAIMRAENIREALTSDRHFRQAGFRVLL
ncbi:MAG: type II toxin-antitoxin system VapC family toxin [Planctomycetes bacterium]|nr:type II toxin-antitoxin system VapC family toxin [Planctomycetota bacterium]